MPARIGGLHYTRMPGPTMTRTITSIDHIGIAARDPAANQAAFRRMGFAVTDPKPLMAIDESGKAVPIGQQSQHFVFQDTYVELTAVPASETSNHLEPYLRRYEGLHILALASDSADAARAELAAAGLAPGPVLRASREVVYGNPGRADFKWFVIPDAEAPGGLVCAVEHLSREVVFQDAVMNHANGALALIEVTLCAEDVEDTCARYRRLLGAPSTPLGHGQAFDLGQTRLVITGAEGLAERYDGVAPLGLPCLAGFTVLAADVAHVATVLNENGIAHSGLAPGGLWVPATAAGGAIVEFRGEG